MASIPTMEYGLRILLTKPCNQGFIKVAAGSVIDFSGDCIVNAANTKGIGGGGVDGAINDAGGSRFIEARIAFPEIEPGIRIPWGESRITVRRFGSLKCQAIIHTASANFHHSLYAE